MKTRPGLLLRLRSFSGRKLLQWTQEASQGTSHCQGYLVASCSYLISSESPVDTPRPFKRSVSHRFPVNPAAVGRSKSPGPPKPALPNKSQFRDKGNNAQLSNSRYPSGSSSTGAANRTRRDAENGLQAPQISKSRRMGMFHKQSPVGVMDDSAANRNSFHLRGTSHNSALKEKQRQHARNISGTGSNSSMDLDRSQGGFFRRMSSLPEQRAPVATFNPATEGAKSLLFALHSLHPYMSSLLHLAGADGSKRSSLERVFYNSSSQLDALDQSLQAIDQSPPTDEAERRQQEQNIRRACKACLVAYAQVGRLLIKNAQHLVMNADPRYLRMLLILIYGSTIEAGNAFQTMSKSSEGRLGHQKPQFLADSLTNIVPKLTVPSIGPGHERSLTASQRPRQEQPNKDRTQIAESSAQHEKSVSQPSQPSFGPGRPNGRIQANPRTAGFNSASSASTTRSGGPFFMPSTPVIATPDARVGQSRGEDPQDALFEKILSSFQTFVNETQRVFEMVTAELDRRLERARNSNENKSRIELWNHIAGHAHATLALCQALSKEFASLDSNSREMRSSAEFWQRVVKPGLSFADFCSQVKQATTSYRGELVLIETFKAVKPCLRLLKAASTNLEMSPWKNAPTQSPTTFNQKLTVQTQWPPGSASNPSPQHKINGHHRAKNGSGSGSSPYLPTTPLSAALGPAAAATGPSSSGTGSFDRSFQGDVFQRAAFALNNSGHSTFRRNG
jgi:RAM signalling pathway protein